MNEATERNISRLPVFGTTLTGIAWMRPRCYELAARPACRHVQPGTTNPLTLVASVRPQAVFTAASEAAATYVVNVWISAASKAVMPDEGVHAAARRRAALGRPNLLDLRLQRVTGISLERVDRDGTAIDFDKLIQDTIDLLEGRTEAFADAASCRSESATYSSTASLLRMRPCESNRITTRRLRFG